MCVGLYFLGARMSKFVVSIFVKRINIKATF